MIRIKKHMDNRYGRNSVPTDTAKNSQMLTSRTAVVEEPIEQKEKQAPDVYLIPGTVAPVRSIQERREGLVWPEEVYQQERDYLETTSVKPVYKQTTIEPTRVTGTTTTTQQRRIVPTIKATTTTTADRPTSRTGTEQQRVISVNVLPDYPSADILPVKRQRVERGVVLPVEEPIELTTPVTATSTTEEIQTMEEAVDQEEPFYTSGSIDTGGGYVGGGGGVYYEEEPVTDELIEEDVSTIPIAQVDLTEKDEKFNWKTFAIGASVCGVVLGIGTLIWIKTR